MEREYDLKEREYMDGKNRMVIKIGDVEEKVPGTDTLRVVRGKYAAVKVDYQKGKGIYIRVNETELSWHTNGDGYGWMTEAFVLGKASAGARLTIDERKRRSRKKEKQIYEHLKEKLDLELFKEAYIKHNGDSIEVENKAVQGLQIVMDALGGFGTN
jgi:hypothetical protein